jgi:uncharacterized repeat protein (TIGR01451 family)
VAQVSVDTGYDLASIGTPANATTTIGETASFAYFLENRGNATLRIYVETSTHPSSQGDSGASNNANWNLIGSYKVYTDSNNNDVWNTGDTIIGNQGTANYIQLAAGASDTLVLVIVVPTDANNNETTTGFVMFSNRATIVNAGGDGWQDSVPIATNDSRDTQSDTVTLTVSGPNVIVDKTLTEETSGRSRPGDTLIINITFDNDGTDSARGLEIYDAVPNFARYIKLSADSGIFGLYGTSGFLGQTATSYIETDITVTFDTDAVGTTLDFKDTEGNQSDTTSTTGVASTVKAIRWTMELTVGETNGDAVGTVEFNDGVYDNGRVAYRVRID